MKTIYRIIGVILLAYLSPNLSGDEKSDSKTPLSDSERGIPRKASQDKKIQGIGQLLLEAAANSDLPKIESALTAGADSNYADSENRTALYFAYEKEKTEIISYLKKNGANETNLTKLFRMEKSCAKEYGKQNYKGVIKETERIQKEKIQYEALFQKEDKTLSLEQNTFLNVVYYRAFPFSIK